MGGYISAAGDCAIARAVHSPVENDTPAVQRTPVPCFTDDKILQPYRCRGAQPAGSSAAARGASPALVPLPASGKPVQGQEAEPGAEGFCSSQLSFQPRSGLLPLLTRD